MSLETTRIDACFDSHVHWMSTGEVTTRLRLEGLLSPASLKDLKPQPQNFRGEWLLGFGWDDTKWTVKPRREHLDQIFPNNLVAFSRCDGHALWVNSRALKHCALPETGTGVLIDQECYAVENQIPAASGLEMRRHLLKGVKTFNDAGFTHIRDMTCNEAQWNEAVRLDESGLLTLAVEEYFWLQSEADLDSVVALTNRAKKTQTANLRVKGIKIFIDGALGSEGAWLSCGYRNGAHRGSNLWEKAAFCEVLKRCWEDQLEVAVHAIGDEAADWLVSVALELKSAGHEGPLHIEHGEVMRPETILKMKGLGIECHLQPAHWLNDHHWLREKIGDLAQFAFPWRRLQELGLPFDFGSDSPIEPASLSRTLQALRESSDWGVPRLLGLPTSYMGHRDLSWAPNSFTLLAEEVPTQVVFRGEHL